MLIFFVVYQQLENQFSSPWSTGQRRLSPLVG